MKVGDLVRVRIGVDSSKIGVIVRENEDYPHFTDAKFGVAIEGSKFSNFTQTCLEVINESG